MNAQFAILIALAAIFETGVIAGLLTLFMPPEAHLKMRRPLITAVTLGVANTAIVVAMRMWLHENGVLLAIPACFILDGIVLRFAHRLSRRQLAIAWGILLAWWIVREFAAAFFVST